MRGPCMDFACIPSSDRLGRAQTTMIYLKTLLPSSRITKPYAWLTIGILLANILGAPLAAGLLSMDGLCGLQGWQWLFMLEGIPAIILGVVVFFLLPSTPQTASWLTDADRELLAEEVSRKSKGRFSWCEREGAFKWWERASSGGEEGGGAFNWEEGCIG